ncbi:ion transporter [Rhodospirillum centenum]|uniref:Cation channel family protein n=1 Tax=Rhodospirillum centenum (strain ATCC 51521 / SW) TaxID=414684 RepID=B6IV87_RHOCS|nr:ion transporter [Rhodospirillum centenum]ACJ00211.1 cation channel family protein [Rhodospirillum centenum SW]
MTDSALPAAADAPAAPAPSALRRLVESVGFQRFIVAVILVNAVTLGLETSATAMAAAGPLLTVLDRLALAVFVVELGLKLAVYRLSFFRQGWNNFDFTIVALSLAPLIGVAGAGNLSVLRALRILRVLRLLSVVPQMRAVVQALFGALPGMGAIIAVLALIYYVSAVLATKLFGTSFPDWFGSIGRSMYSLFQIMTLESWSMGIVRPVMEVYPYAWVFFVPFIVLVTFAVLNLFIAIIVNSMQSLHDADTKAEAEERELKAHGERTAMADELRALRAEIAGLKEAVLRRD